MLEPFSGGLMALWLSVSGGAEAIDQEQLATLWNTPNVVLSGNVEPKAQAVLQQYLAKLKTAGFPHTTQGIWVQSKEGILAAHQGNVPLSAASLTKVATTLVALKTWGTDYQFVTQVSSTGPIVQGVLQGDLVIQGNGDPLFVWEEAIALGNALNKLGIKKVTGNLVIVGNFSMNYETSPLKSGQLLKQGFNTKEWSGETEAQYQSLPSGTPKPQVTITGTVQPVSQPPVNQQVLIRHHSLPLVQLLKLMNTYSNNAMSQSLADSLGGAQVVARQAAIAGGFPPAEIQLINGSGLGQENRISPRAVAAMFMAIDRYLRPALPLVKQPTYTIADLFPVMGREKGTIEDREMPLGSIVKTGTLWDVSALAGILPSRDQGPIWFTVINKGDNVEGFRKQQDQLLQSLIRQWGKPAQLPITITPQNNSEQEQYRLGSPSRIEIVSSETPKE